MDSELNKNQVPLERLWNYLFNDTQGGATLFLGGSNEPPDFQKKKNYIYKFFFFFSLIL